jgi:metal transporter CNNM
VDERGLVVLVLVARGLIIYIIFNAIMKSSTRLLLVLFVTILQLAKQQFVLAQKNENNNYTNNVIEGTLLQAAILLASVGVTDLCHPTRDDLPGFSLCVLPVPSTSSFSSTSASSSSTSSSSSSSALSARHLGDSYYDYPGDDVYEPEEEPPTEEEIRESRIEFIMRMTGATLCVCFGGLASGLTVGLLSLDPLLLLIKSRGSSEESAEEKSYAEKLLPIIRQHHLLLCTLLLLNTIAGEALPMFLNELVPEWAAVLISVVLVLFFGEILPSAVFTGPNQMKMAASWVNTVKCLMWIFWPIAYPIARLLDKILDHTDEAAGPLYNRGELAAMIRIQYEERIAAKQRRTQALHESGAREGGDVLTPMIFNTSLRDLKQTLLSQQPNHPHMHARSTSSIHLDEVMIAEGALQMRTRAALDLHVPYVGVFCVSIDTILDDKNISKIYSSGYSRIPVYEGHDRTKIKGILMTRQLIVVKADSRTCIKELPLHIPTCVGPETNLVELVNQFQTGGSVTRRGGHLALVCNRPDLGNEALERDEAVPAEAGLLGIITLEDVLEALLQEQIYDERDALGRGMQPLEISCAGSDVSGPSEFRSGAGDFIHELS